MNSQEEINLPVILYNQIGNIDFFIVYYKSVKLACFACPTYTGKYDHLQDTSFPIYNLVANLHLK